MDTAPGSMLEMLMNKARWSFIIRGVIAIVFGILVFIWPLHTLAVLILLFGVFAIVNGVVAVLGALQSLREHQHAWLRGLAGVLSILAGIAALVWPRETAVILFLIIALWAIVTGIVEIGAAFQFRQLGVEAWILAASGVISILFGVILLVWPRTGMLALAWLIGVYAIIYGLLLLSRASLLHELEKSSQVGNPQG